MMRGSSLGRVLVCGLLKLSGDTIYEPGPVRDRYLVTL